MEKEKNKLGTLISITTPKGGVGKTTTLGLLSTSLFNLYPELKIAVVDIDERFNFVKKRQLEKQLISSGDNTLLKVLNDNMIKRAGDELMTSIYKLDIKDDFKDILNKLKTLQSSFDIVFIDFPGSLTLHDNTLRLLKHLNFIFIPTFVDDNTMFSTLEFLEGIQNLKSKKYIKADVFVFFNKVSKNKNISEYEDAILEISKSIKNKEISLLNSIVPDRVELQRYSTILSPRYTGGSDNVFNWIDEIYTIIK